MPDGHLGTVAQALSHLLLLEQIGKASVDGALVFEDDATFSDNFALALSQLLDVAPPDWDVIFLSCDTATCGERLPDSKWFTRPNAQCDLSTVAYVVRQGAAALITKHLIPLKSSIASAYTSAEFVARFHVYCLSARVVAQHPLRPDR